MTTAYLFDTTAISETLRARPNTRFVDWLGRLDRDRQFTSAVVVGELYAGAFRSAAPERWLRRIDEAVLHALTVLPFDVAVARTYGEVQARLLRGGTPIGEADTQIAATALAHGLTLVAANPRHFGRVTGLALEVFAPGASPRV
jgi:predicted nucleic acid-binding protein